MWRRVAGAASRTMFDLAVRGASWTDTSAFAAMHRDKPWFTHAWPLQMSEDGWGRPWVAKNAGYDATDRHAALSFMQAHQARGEVVTGHMFVTDIPDSAYHA